MTAAETSRTTEGRAPVVVDHAIDVVLGSAIPASQSMNRPAAEWLGRYTHGHLIPLRFGDGDKWFVGLARGDDKHYSTSDDLDQARDA